VCLCVCLCVLCVWCVSCVVMHKQCSHRERTEYYHAGRERKKPPNFAGRELSQVSLCWKGVESLKVRNSHSERGKNSDKPPIASTQLSFFSPAGQGRSSQKCRQQGKKSCEISKRQNGWTSKNAFFSSSGFQTSSHFFYAQNQKPQ